MKQPQVIVIEDDDDTPLKQGVRNKMKKHDNLLLSMCPMRDKIRSQQIEKIPASSKLEQEQAYKQKLIDYFKQTCNVDLQGNFEDKFTPDYNEETLVLEKEAVVVYGVDFMDTKRVLKHFGVYNVKELNWINDSSCKIVFEDEDAAQNVFANERAQNFIEEETDPKKWYQLHHYNELGIKKKLEARVSTNIDKIKETTGLDSKRNFKFYSYEEAKNKLIERQEEEYKASKQFQMQKEWDDKRLRRRNDHRYHRHDDSQDNRTRRENNNYDHRKKIRKQPRSSEYSFERIERPNDPQREDELDLSFRRKEGNAREDEEGSRINYSFLRNPQLKEEADREAGQQRDNYSFIRRVDTGEQKLTLDLSRLSLVKSRGEMNKSKDIILILD